MDHGLSYHTLTSQNTVDKLHQENELGFGDWDSCIGESGFRGNYGGAMSGEGERKERMKRDRERHKRRRKRGQGEKIREK